MPRGGKRNGKPGVAYSQRSDLNALPRTAATGQQYGQATAQMQAQSAVPMGSPTPPTPAGGAGVAQGPSAPLIPLTAESARPDEVVQTGLAQGPGPGPEVLGGMVDDDDPAIADLRAAFMIYPSEYLRGLIEQLEDE